jgi:predicted transcriptional regulator YdeE
MEPQLVSRSELKLIGIQVRTNNRDEMAPSTARIPGLWGRFFQDRVAERIPHERRSGHIIAAYTKYETDHTGPYTLVVGPEVRDLDSIPSGLTGLTIPAGQYLVFTAHGEMPKALIDMWIHIWSYFSESARHKRLYTTDYEVHRDNERVDIHIAVT